MWIFPSQAPAAVPEGVVVAGYGSPEAERARREGRNLLLLANQSGAPNFVMGWWNLGSQCGTAFLPHPALGDFPHEPFLSPLVFRMIKEGLKLPVEGYSEADYIAVGEGLQDAYLYLAARERPDGSREALAAGLDVVSDTAESRSLRRNLLNWLAEGKKKGETK
jgi:hypothetical protein